VVNEKTGVDFEIGGIVHTNPEIEKAQREVGRDSQGRRLPEGYDGGVI